MLKSTYVLLFLMAIPAMAALPLMGQTTMQNQTQVPTNYRPPDPTGQEIYGGYMIGIGDILDIHVNDEDSITGRYQVDQSGNVRLPLLPDPIPAANSSTFDLARRLSADLKKQNILRDPAVTVLIARGMTQNVSILGAVMRPGTYPIEKPTTLVDLISMAGGLAPNAGSSATITHNAEARTSGYVDTKPQDANPESTTINLTTLIAIKDPAATPQVHAGDVIDISSAPVVFVVGSVTRPGAFSVQDQQSKMTVLQAVAMAEGTTPTASLSHAIIIRQSSSDAERREIPIDLKKVMRGHAKDEVLMANDILFVPQSGLKAGLHTMGQIGTQAAGETVGYGLGLRLGP